MLAKLKRAQYCITTYLSVDGRSFSQLEDWISAVEVNVQAKEKDVQTVSELKGEIKVGAWDKDDDLGGWCRVVDSFQRCLGSSALLQSSLAGNRANVGSPVERGRARSRVKKVGINSYALAGNLGSDRKVKNVLFSEKEENVLFSGKEVLDKEFVLTKLKWLSLGSQLASLWMVCPFSIGGWDFSNEGGKSGEGKFCLNGQRVEWRRQGWCRG